MIRRVKSNQSNLIKITNWHEADRIVRNIGDLQTWISKTQDRAQRKIDQVKADLVKDVKSTQEMIDRKVRSLEAFAVAREDEFGKKRSRKLNFGCLGWRKSTSITVKKTTLDLIKKIFGKKAVIYIRAKEGVDKEALAKLTDEQLAGVGARRKVKDDFFVEPDFTKAADYGK